MLKSVGNDVTILARGERLEYLKKNGINLRDDIKHESFQIDIEVTHKLTPDDTYDLVLVIMQRQQVSEILAILKANQNISSIIFVGNNMEGADEYLKFLNKQRILLGFGGVGGYRENQLVVSGYLDQITFYVGELDGKVSDRLKLIEEIFIHSGIEVKLIENIDAWLKTHVSFIAPLAMASYAARNRNTTLGKDIELIDLSIIGIRENIKALKELGITILPKKFRMLSWIPKLVIRRKLLNLLNSEYGKIALSGHAMAAKNEMMKITEDFREFVKDVKTDLSSNNTLYNLSFA
jgi:2-dehydropantoate 2-reductase